MHKEKILTIKQVQSFWDNMTQAYAEFDCVPQSFYFSIISMLHMHQAKNVLEVGCGRCVLLPYCLQLLGPNATYLATDLSPKMIQCAKTRLTLSIKKSGTTLSLEEWCAKNKVTIRVANGEQPIESTIKFDRIICNMVLMLTEDAEKMLKSLYEQAEEGCLLGASVWGNRDLDLFIQQISRVIKDFGLEQPKSRSNFHLYNNVAQIAEKFGWKLVVSWQQVSTFPYLTVQETQRWAISLTNNMIFFSQDQRKKIHDQFLSRIRKRLHEEKQALAFSSQIVILKK